MNIEIPTKFQRYKGDFWFLADSMKIINSPSFKFLGQLSQRAPCKL